jgi:hypothetical protein
MSPSSTPTKRRLDQRIINFPYEVSDARLRFAYSRDSEVQSAHKPFLDAEPLHGPLSQS